MRYSLVAILLGLVGSAAGSVTLGVRQFVDVNKVPAVMFAGTVSNHGEGEVVDVLARDCGAATEHLVATARTTSGGAFQVEALISVPPQWFHGVYSGSTFRARWEGSFSAPFTWRLAAKPQLARVSGTRRWVVHVVAATPSGPTGLNGRPVELQRQTARGWVRVRSARLVRKASLRWGAFNYQATFTIPTRRLRLRAYVPEQSAAPCFLPGASAPWRS